MKWSKEGLKTLLRHGRKNHGSWEAHVKLGEDCMPDEDYTDFIVDARAVFIETGCTPRELKTHRDKAKEALKIAQQAFAGIICNCSEGPEVFSRLVLMESIEKEANRAWKSVTDALAQLEED